LLGKPKNLFLIKAAGYELLIEKQNKEGKVHRKFQIVRDVIKRELAASVCKNCVVGRLQRKGKEGVHQVRGRDK